MGRYRRQTRTLTGFILLCLVGTGPVSAQEWEWSVDLGIERSDVTLDEVDDVWGTERLQLSFRDPERGGVSLEALRLTRFEQVDAAFVFGGYRRFGDWTMSGRVGVAPNADFLYRQSFEGDLSKRIVGTLVAQLRYRYLNFSAARVHILSPAATYYYSRGELEGRVFLVRNTTRAVDSQSFLVRGFHNLNDRIRIGGGVAAGERIFDITFLPGEPAEGWIAYADTLIRVHARGAIGVVIGLAHEEPSFDRRNLAVYYRRWF